MTLAVLRGLALLDAALLLYLFLTYERSMRGFCDLAFNGEGCDRYAALMDARLLTDRAATYRQRACTRGYRPACAAP